MAASISPGSASDISSAQVISPSLFKPYMNRTDGWKTSQFVISEAKTHPKSAQWNDSVLVEV